MREIDLRQVYRRFPGAVVRNICVPSHHILSLRIIDGGSDNSVKNMFLAVCSCQYLEPSQRWLPVALIFS